MSAHPSDKYKALLNYMHNDLKITKEDIREWTKEAVTDVAQRYVEKQMEKGLVEQEFNSIIRSKSFSFWGSEETLDDWVKHEVVKQLMNGVNLRVSVLKSSKGATKAPRKVTIRKPRKG